MPAPERDNVRVLPSQPPPAPPEERLLQDETAYGEHFKAHLLDQYKVFVEMMDRVSARRLTINQFFLTINTALVAFLGATATLGMKTLTLPWAVCVAFSGVVLCYTWHGVLRSYQGLNTGKFKVIHELEQHLPAALFRGEWKHVGEGKNPKLYNPSTKLEMRIPWVFGAIYGILASWCALETIVKR